jgi:hypothetical protein
VTGARSRDRHPTRAPAWHTPSRPQLP